MTYGWHVCEAARKLQAGADVKKRRGISGGPAGAYGDHALHVYAALFVKKERPCLCGSRIRRRAARPAPHHPYGGRHHLHHRQGARRQRRDARAHRPDQKSGWQRARLISSAQRTMATPKCWPRCAKNEFGYAPAATFLLGAAVATNTGPQIAVAIVYQGEKPPLNHPFLPDEQASAPHKNIKENVPMGNPILYIVIPCYNEEAVLPLTSGMFLKKNQRPCRSGQDIGQKPHTVRQRRFQG